jgi:hypothetical protein
MNLDSSDENDEDSGEFKINKAYATSYDEWRRKEELHKRGFANYHFHMCGVRKISDC